MKRAGEIPNEVRTHKVQNLEKNETGGGQAYTKLSISRADAQRRIKYTR